MAQAFISYASRDSIFADLAKMKLQEAGVQVWLDQGALRVGEDWRRAIDEGISSSDVFLVVITPQSCESPYVTYEWAFALGRGIKVIPLLLEDAEIHPRLAVLQHLDFRDKKALPWKALVQELQKINPVAANRASAYVRDMNIDQLHELIASAVSLASATARTAGKQAGAEDISGAAMSVVGAMQHAASGGPARSEHILWVDDRPDNNTHERSAFEFIGFKFTLALSTNEALQVLEKERFAAIISDMGRKEGPREGYVLLDALRSNGDQTPFFIYAGSNAPEHKREAGEHGAQGSTNRAKELFDLVTQTLA